MQNEYVSIYITNMDEESINVIQHKHNEKFQIENNIIHMEIPKFLGDNSLVVELQDFLEKLKNNKRYQITSNCIFDVDNLVLITPDKKDYLTLKEGAFLKHLIKNSFITYDYMIEFLWNNNCDISQNALRQFVKNINKKLPSKILRNIRGMGYKLNKYPTISN